MTNSRLRKVALNLILSLLAMFASLYTHVVYAGTTAGGSVQGTLFDSTGAPVTSTSVNFKLQVLDKNAACVLYEEIHLGVNLSQTNGDFSLDLGSGTSGVNNTNGTAVLDPSIFRNDRSLTAFTGCPSGLIFASGDERLIRVQFDVAGGSTYALLSPDMKVAGGAYSAVAETLQGKKPSDFIQVVNNGTAVLTQSNVENIFSVANYPILTSLLAGTLPTTGGSVINVNNQRLTGVATPGTTSDAVNKGYADTYIGGKQTDLTGVGTGFGGGQTLVWDQINGRWTTGSAVTSDNTKLPLAGGTMTGPVTMSGFDLFAVGNITMQAQKTLMLGRYTDAQEATLLANLTTLGTGATGTSWYNTDSKTLKIWHGTAAAKQAYLSSTDKLDASWIPNTAVTAATYGAAGTVPVFTVGADGRITAAYGTTISGIAPSGNASGDLTGTYPAPQIKNNAITADKINSTGVAINRLIATDSSVPNNLTYFECPDPDDIMHWTTNGWQCTTVGALSPVKTVASKTPDAAGNVALTAYDINGIESAATKEYGTGAGELVELDVNGKIPASLLPTTSLSWP
ncbi:MAG: hypothetical protein KF799_15100, partial [Bdellovibrionales bacterium]|nr:hypothetical protein [Bdellovibrionales bacterium]